MKNLELETQNRLLGYNWTMNLNVSGKIAYIQKIIKYYPRWYRVFGSRLLNKPLKKARLSNGLTIIAGENSLILDLVDEIFIREVYNPRGMKIKKGDTVIDIGANIGLFSLYATQNGASKVYAIEPLEGNRKAIERNFESNSLKKPEIIKKAVTNKAGYAKLFIGNLDSHGSTTKRTDGKSLTKTMKVKTDTLENITKKYKIQKIDFLKIDCEGGEGTIMFSFSKRLAQITENIAIEYHNHLSTISHQEIAQKLRRLGFKVKISPSNSNLGYIYSKRI